MSEQLSEDAERVRSLADEIQNNPYERERWLEDASEEEALNVAAALTRLLAALDPAQSPEQPTCAASSGPSVQGEPCGRCDCQPASTGVREDDTRVGLAERLEETSQVTHSLPLGVRGLLREAAEALRHSGVRPIRDPWCDDLAEPVPAVREEARAESVERHDGDGAPPCFGQWCCGCDEHPVGKPWGWNAAAWERHYDECHDEPASTRVREGDELCGETVHPFRANCMLPKGHEGPHKMTRRVRGDDEADHSRSVGVTDCADADIDAVSNLVAAHGNADHIAAMDRLIARTTLKGEDE